MTNTESESSLFQELVDFSDNRLLIDVCGEFDANLAAIERSFDIQIVRRGNQLALIGDEDNVQRAATLLKELYTRAEDGKSLEQVDFMRILSVFDSVEANQDAKENQLEMFSKGGIEIKTRKKTIEPRTPAQKHYVKALVEHDLSFGIGPAGTGKTYLAVAVAVSKFISGEVDRIIFSRPAVEAGEKLGYLPGDMKEKVDPYMQPLYDALNDFLPARQLAKYIEEKKIEIAPLAFMRGRTLAHAFVVLDEAQNATNMQMKMFLTRLGEGSKMVITGDLSQIDLPKGVVSGLYEAERLLSDVDDISFSYFSASDVVRHPMVAKIIKAYEKGQSRGIST